MAFELKERIAGTLRNLVAAPLERGDRNARILAIASSKGGVGKTTTSVNLAAAYARRGARVLLVDLDPQAHVAASLGATPPTTPGQLSDVLLGRLREVCEVVFPARQQNLHLAGSDKQLAETEMILSAKIGKELILAGALGVTRTRYDLVVLDCPPNLGTLALNALCAADALLVPADASVLALEGIGDILAAVETVRTRLGRSVQPLGILATRHDRRASRMNDTIRRSIGDLYGDLSLGTAIPQCSALNKAHMAGASIFDVDARSTGAQAYAALADELAPRLGLAQLAAAAAPAVRAKTAR